MIKDRDDWCISRQRVWGVPIPVFYAEDGTAILDKDIINHVADIVEKEGTNAWFNKDAKDLLPEGYTHPGSPNGKFTKETDIMDVWFDSGSSHQASLKATYGVYPADVYLEGSDQYRGWFNSSISTGVALTGEAPYKTVITHGFTLDGEGRKMSKSLGNTIDPLVVCKESGADILRLWVAGVAYQSDMRISKELLNQTSESYRKIRNTFRFMLGNLFDFNPETDIVNYQDLSEVDQYMLCTANELIDKVQNAYQKYAFDEVYRSILTYMTNDLSSFYLDFTKDILYIEKADSHARRCIQTVIYKIALALAKLLTPIIPHTAEEVYSYMPGNKEDSIYLCEMPDCVKYPNADELTAKFAEFNLLRADILKALEEARNAKVIGKSFAAEVTLYPAPHVAKLIKTLNFNLGQVFIVSKFNLSTTEIDGVQYDSGTIKVEAAKGVVCSRCWQVVDEINEDELCPRCAEVLKK